MQGEEKSNSLKVVGVCELNAEKQTEWKELVEIARANRIAINKVNEGMAKLVESQSHVSGLLEELKPLRTLPDISDNLTSIVEQLIPSATKKSSDWASIIIIIILSALLVVVVFKDSSFKGGLKVMGSEAHFESNSTEKETN